MIQSKKILVATDFGDASNAALEHGRAVAQSFGATLAVLHVANVISIGIGEAGGKFDEVQREADDAARAQVDAMFALCPSSVGHIGDGGCSSTASSPW